MRIMAITLSLFAISFAVAEDGKPAAGKQVEQTLGTAEEPVVRYQLYLPKDYDKSDKKWPLIYFLHGRGESYGPLSLVKKRGDSIIGQIVDFFLVDIVFSAHGSANVNSKRTAN